MGKWKVFVPVALSLVIAISGSLYLYKWLRSQTAVKEIVKVEAEAVPVAVARVELAWGTKLAPDMIKTAPFLKESLPQGFISDVSQLKDRVIIAALRPNEPITEHKLAPRDVTAGGVGAVIEHGKRAIAVKGDMVIGISGFIRPGDRVDVLVTLTLPKTKAEMTKLVLENIPVLATGTQMQENGKGEPMPVDVYTLEVSPEEGEKLALAASKGKLQFALRNVTDADKVVTRGATIAQTLASLRPEESKKSASPKAYAPSSVTVEVIKGSQVTQTKMKL
jgi:pilus assembly protein CpaB